MGISEYRRKDNRLIMLCKGLTGAANIPVNDFFLHSRCTWQHLSKPIGWDWYLQVECLPPIIRDWNSLAYWYSLISTAECPYDSFIMLYLLYGHIPLFLLLSVHMVRLLCYISCMAIFPYFYCWVSTWFVYYVISLVWPYSLISTAECATGSFSMLYLL